MVQFFAAQTILTVALKVLQNDADKRAALFKHLLYLAPRLAMPVRKKIFQVCAHIAVYHEEFLVSLFSEIQKSIDNIFFDDSSMTVYGVLSEVPSEAEKTRHSFSKIRQLAPQVRFPRIWSEGSFCFECWIAWCAVPNFTNSSLHTVQDLLKSITGSSGMNSIMILKQGEAIVAWMQGAESLGDPVSSIVFEAIMPIIVQTDPILSSLSSANDYPVLSILGRIFRLFGILVIDEIVETLHSMNTQRFLHITLELTKMEYLMNETDDEENFYDPEVRCESGFNSNYDSFNEVGVVVGFWGALFDAFQRVKDFESFRENHCEMVGFVLSTLVSMPQSTWSISRRVWQSAYSLYPEIVWGLIDSHLVKQEFTPVHQDWTTWMVYEVCTYLPRLPGGKADQIVHSALKSTVKNFCESKNHTSPKYFYAIMAAAPLMEPETSLIAANHLLAISCPSNLTSPLVSAFGALKNVEELAIKKVEKVSDLGEDFWKIVCKSIFKVVEDLNSYSDHDSVIQALKIIPQFLDHNSNRIRILIDSASSLDTLIDYMPDILTKIETLCFSAVQKLTTTDGSYNQNDSSTKGRCSLIDCLLSIITRSGYGSRYGAAILEVLSPLFNYTIASLDSDLLPILDAVAIAHPSFTEPLIISLFQSFNEINERYNSVNSRRFANDNHNHAFNSMNSKNPAITCSHLESSIPSIMSEDPVEESLIKILPLLTRISISSCKVTDGKISEILVTMLLIISNRMIDYAMSDELIRLVSRFYLSVLRNHECLKGNPIVKELFILALLTCQRKLTPSNIEIFGPVLHALFPLDPITNGRIVQATFPDKIETVKIMLACRIPRKFSLHLIDLVQNQSK